MSRFDFEYDDGEGLPYGLWQANVSKALGGRRGQEALAEMETALLALPERKLCDGFLAVDGSVCAIGAFVAHKKAQRDGVDIAAVIEAMSMEVRCWCGHGKTAHTLNADGGGDSCGGQRERWDREKGVYHVPCDCDHYAPEADEEGALPTAEAGQSEGLTFTLAWHLAFLNDEKFGNATPEQRYAEMLAWVRRAQGKAVAA